MAAKQEKYTGMAGVFGGMRLEEIRARLRKNHANTTHACLPGSKEEQNTMASQPDIQPLRVIRPHREMAEPRRERNAVPSVPVDQIPTALLVKPQHEQPIPPPAPVWLLPRVLGTVRGGHARHKSYLLRFHSNLEDGGFDSMIVVLGASGGGWIWRENTDMHLKTAPQYFSCDEIHQLVLASDDAMACLGTSPDQGPDGEGA